MSLLKRIEMAREARELFLMGSVALRAAFAFGEWPPERILPRGVTLVGTGFSTLPFRAYVKGTVYSVTNDPAVRVP